MRPGLIWVINGPNGPEMRLPLFPRVWTAPSWQELSSRLQMVGAPHVFGLLARFT